MKKVGVVQKATGVVAAALSVMFAAPISQAQAQITSIFPAGWDSNVRDRLFMRLGYVSINTKTQSSDVRDVTGNVVSKAELLAAFNRGQAISIACDNGDPSCIPDLNDDNGGESYVQAKGLLQTSLNYYGYDGLGTPPGIKVKSQKHIGTPVISLGYWLDRNEKWLLEGFVIGAPMTVKVSGDGTRNTGQPNQINGKHVATTKLLPLLAIGSYQFLDRSALVRPYVGLGATYAIFFDSKTTPFLDGYVGGKTAVSIKNALGIGPFVGLTSNLNDRWHVSLSVGQVKLKTTATMVTRNSQINSGDAVLLDYPGGKTGDPADLVGAIKKGDTICCATATTQNGTRNGMTTAIMTLIKTARGGNANSDLGTFERKVDQTLTNTIMSVSVGYQF